jgi:hypothetical protein
LRSVLSFIVYLFFTFNLAYSAGLTADNIAKVIQHSTSGKTIILDKGLNHFIKNKDFGVLLQKTFNKEDNRFYYKPVAKIKAVKVFNETSVWVAYKTFISKAIYKDSSLLMLSESALLNGRKLLKVDRSKIITTKNNTTKQVADYLKESPDSLGTKDNLYSSNRELHDKEVILETDAKLVDIDQWEDLAGNSRLSGKSIYKSAYNKEFSNQQRVQTFEKMVVAFLKKYNDPKFTLRKLYYGARTQGEDGGFNLDGIQGTYFSRYLDSEKKIEEKEKKVFKDLLSRGESWSDEYSDEELSELVYNIGSIKERERRETIAAHKFNYQVYTNFGTNLVNNENLQDRDNTAQSKYDFEIGWEYFFLKDIESLNRLTIEVSGRRAVDAFSIGGGFNATSIEYSLAANINWYPFHLPNVLEENIIYFSAVFRTGLSLLSLTEDNENGNYQISSFPGFKAGIKYNFTNSFGVRASFGLEDITASRIAREFDDGNLPDQISYREGKLSFGISKFF